MGLSQKDFAIMLGVRQATVSEWETGIHTPLGMGQRLLDCLGEKHDYPAEKK